MNPVQRRLLKKATILILITTFFLGSDAFSDPSEAWFTAIANQKLDYFISLEGCKNAELSSEYVNKGNRLKKQKEHKKAIDYFKNAIDQCPQNPVPYLMIGSIYSELSEQKMNSDSAVAKIALKTSVKWTEHALKILKLKENIFIAKNMTPESTQRATLFCFCSLSSSYQSLGNTEKAVYFFNKMKSLKQNTE